MEDLFDACNVFYEIVVDGSSTLLDTMSDEVDIFYEQEESDEQA